MLVDPAGLAAAAARLTEALAAVTGDPVHPPLGADPTSTGAAERLSAAGTALAAGLSAQAAALVATAEQLGLVSAGYTGTDEANAHRIATLGGGAGGPRSTGAAPAAPPLPPDTRSPLPTTPMASGEAIATAVHAGDPAAGEGFSTSWSRVAAAACEAAETVRSVIGHLPEMLDSPHAAPAVTAHLTTYAAGFDAAGNRAGRLAGQAAEHAVLRTQAGQQIPTPQQFTEANQRWQRIALANAQSGGKYAVPLAQAQADLTALNTQAVTSYGQYSTGTDAATGEGDAPGQGPDGAARSGQGADGEDPLAGTPGHPGLGTGEAADGAAGGAGSPEAMGQFASMIPTVLGAAGGLLGGLTKVPETLMQGGMQAMQAATQGLSQMASTKPDTSGLGTDPSLADPALGDPGLGGTGGGGGGEVTPMSGGPPLVPGSVTPSTGPPPTPPSVPAGGGLPPPVTPGGGVGGGGMPMGMPMGGMGGGAGGGGRADEPREKKIVTPPLPHSEAVTGKVSVDRMATSATARTDRDDPPDDDPPEGLRSPTVRRITMPRRDPEP